MSVYFSLNPKRHIMLASRRYRGLRPLEAVCRWHDILGAPSHICSHLGDLGTVDKARPGIPTARGALLHHSPRFCSSFLSLLMSLSSLTWSTVLSYKSITSADLTYEARFALRSVSSSRRRMSWSNTGCSAGSSGRGVEGVSVIAKMQVVREDMLVQCSSAWLVSGRARARWIGWVAIGCCYVFLSCVTKDMEDYRGSAILPKLAQDSGEVGSRDAKLRLAPRDMPEHKTLFCSSSDQ